MRGPIVKPGAGKMGLVLACSGVAVAAASLFVPVSFGPPVVLGGALVYLVGALLAAAAFGYVRGGWLFTWLRVLRLLLAVIVILLVVRMAAA
jgi:hypothetical protein